jgi:hypothetical protein
MRWGEVNKNVNEEDLKCQQKAEHKMTAYLVTLLRLVRKTKKEGWNEDEQMNAWWRWLWMINTMLG